MAGRTVKSKAMEDLTARIEVLEFRVRNLESADRTLLGYIDRKLSEDDFRTFTDDLGYAKSTEYHRAKWYKVRFWDRW